MTNSLTLIYFVIWSKKLVVHRQPVLLVVFWYINDIMTEKYSIKGEFGLITYLAMIDSPDDQAKFERVYNKYRYLMLHVANKILQNHHDAEDVVHQAFIAVIENLEKIIEIDSPKTRSYIVIITERKAIDLLRKIQKRQTLEFNEDISGVEIPFEMDNPIAVAIAKLPSEYREVLLMRYHNGFSAKEIASILSMSDSGVRKLIVRAKKALQELLEKEGEVV